jgi:4-diphosphocytidyl-2-C-methyl-D-erythritol kinase
MNEFAGKPLSAGRLADVALELGSDVPFFLAESSFALAGGRGEVLLPVDSPLRFTHILINPGYSLSTADIYRRTGVLNLTKKQGIDRMMSTFLEEGNAAGIVENLHNDLQTIVLEDLKDLKSIFRVLAGAGASGVLMSGSGPTVFGLFDKEDLESAAERIKGMEDFDPRWRVIPARTF